MKDSHLFPRSGQTSEIQALVSIIGAVVDQGQGIYVSAPVTTGLRYVRWLRAHPGADPNTPEHREELRTQVMLPNIEDVRPFIKQLRSRHPFVIDPTVFEGSPSWTQVDYRELWADVIRQYARKVVFYDGWEFSHGCAYEFLIAITDGVETVTQNLHSLSIEAGLGKILKAVAQLRSLGVASEFMEAVAEKLEALIGAGHERLR
jgi:hypothetical protein